MLCEVIVLVDEAAVRPEQAQEEEVLLLKKYTDVSNYKEK